MLTFLSLFAQNMWNGLVLQLPFYIALFQAGFVIDPSGWMPYLEAAVDSKSKPRGQ